MATHFQNWQRRTQRERRTVVLSLGRFFALVGALSAYSIARFICRADHDTALRAGTISLLLAGAGGLLFGGIMTRRAVADALS